MNLLTETLRDIRASGHALSDIVFIGSRDGTFSCTYDEFGKLADVEYDNGFGWQEVASDLFIRFSDGGLMRRWEYDGSEGWAFEPSHTSKSPTKPIRTLIEGGWNRLSEMGDNQ